MRSLNVARKLSENEKLFFAPQKAKEELYYLSNDPKELTNLAENPK